MSIRARGPRAPIAAGLVTLAGATLIACGTSTDPIGPTLPSTAESPQISAGAATQLCDMMRAEIGNWQQQGTTVARVSFNGTVHNWALRNGAVNAAITRNREVIDTVTTENCPDVRDQAIAAFGTDDLASALAGF
ncbi:hypothetical protein ACFXK0_25740 [Nocardia sp. NPDC059177]|uniref:hypothetical protein n=1 Tax=Nocardia sp. NPDC059177 TaxID=3346759 RepID=UPI003676921A